MDSIKCKQSLSKQRKSDLSVVLTLWRGDSKLPGVINHATDIEAVANLNPAQAPVIAFDQA